MTCAYCNKPALLVPPSRWPRVDWAGILRDVDSRIVREKLAAARRRDEGNGQKLTKRANEVLTG